MHCDIQYVGKMRNGVPKYWCLTHKALASDKKGNKLETCFSEQKDRYQKRLSLQESKIESIQLFFANLLKNEIPILYINGVVFNGVLTYEDMLLDYKDFVGFFLAQLNHTHLEKVCCSHCKHYHSDNGKFAYTPHKTHLCLYCGHFFREKEANIGSEIAMIFSFPKVNLGSLEIEIGDILSLTYDMLSGSVLINGQKIDTIIINNKKEKLIDFLNRKLEDLY